MLISLSSRISGEHRDPIAQPPLCAVFFKREPEYQWHTTDSYLDALNSILEKLPLETTWRLTSN
jgi:hypothetical protein